MDLMDELESSIQMDELIILTPSSNVLHPKGRARRQARRQARLREVWGRWTAEAADFEEAGSVTKSLKVPWWETKIKKFIKTRETEMIEVFIYACSQESSGKSNNLLETFSERVWLMKRKLGIPLKRVEIFLKKP